MGGVQNQTSQVQANQTREKADGPGLNRPAQGAGGQPPSEQAVVVRSSESERSVRYYVVTRFKVEDWVILGEKHRVIHAVGIRQDERLDYAPNEGAIVIVETNWGFEYCGIARQSAQSKIYINHMGIDIQNVELRVCPSQSEVVPIIQELREHGLSIVSPIMNPWVEIAPYALHVLKNYDTSAYYRVLRGE